MCLYKDNEATEEVRQAIVNGRPIRFYKIYALIRVVEENKLGYMTSVWPYAPIRSVPADIDDNLVIHSNYEDGDNRDSLISHGIHVCIEDMHYHDTEHTYPFEVEVDAEDLLGVDSFKSHAVFKKVKIKGDLDNFFQILRTQPSRQVCQDCNEACCDGECWEEEEEEWDDDYYDDDDDDDEEDEDYYCEYCLAPYCCGECVDDEYL